MTELTKQCLSLKKRDRERLIGLLQESLVKQELPNIEQRFKHLYRIVTDIMGDGILDKIKERNAVTGRRLIAYQMRLDGYSYPKIGKQMGFDRTTISLACDTMQSAFTYPKMYETEIYYWNLFQEKLKHNDTTI